MSTPRRLIRHLSGWKRGDPIPEPIQRTDRNPTKPRFPGPTTAANLERRFDAGKNVADYFDTKRAKVVHPPAEDLSKIIQANRAKREGKRP